MLTSDDVGQAGTEPKQDTGHVVLTHGSKQFPSLHDAEDGWAAVSDEDNDVDASPGSHPDATAQVMIPPGNISATNVHSSKPADNKVTESARRDTARTAVQTRATYEPGWSPHPTAGRSRLETGDPEDEVDSAAATTERRRVRQVYRSVYDDILSQELDSQSVHDASSATVPSDKHSALDVSTSAAAGKRDLATRADEKRSNEVSAELETPGRPVRILASAGSTTSAAVLQPTSSVRAGELSPHLLETPFKGKTGGHTLAARQIALNQVGEAEWDSDTLQQPGDPTPSARSKLSSRHAHPECGVGLATSATTPGAASVKFSAEDYIDDDELDMLLNNKLGSFEARVRHRVEDNAQHRSTSVSDGNMISTRAVAPGVVIGPIVPTVATTRLRDKAPACAAPRKLPVRSSSQREQISLLSSDESDGEIDVMHADDDDGGEHSAPVTRAIPTVHDIDCSAPSSPVLPPLRDRIAANSSLSLAFQGLSNQTSNAAHQSPKRMRNGRAKRSSPAQRSSSPFNSPDAPLARSLFDSLVRDEEDLSAPIASKAPNLKSVSATKGSVLSYFRVVKGGGGGR